MQKNSVFLAASCGDLLLKEKQKKPFVSLNNEVTKASPVCCYLLKARKVFSCIINLYLSPLLY